MKRIFDFIFSLSVLLIFSPLLIILSLIIYFNDFGPVFYMAPRVGQNGRLFRMFKFRTMVVNADKIGASSTTASDKRITRVGKLLRKTKLDELPQFINVLTGQMSVVGPRPEVKSFTDMFTEEEKAILSVKPGITDYASIWNSDEGKILEGAEDPDMAYKELIWPEKKRLQLKYVREHSFWTDIKIVFLTLLIIVRKYT
ncbi:MAG TPA: sugar transferase [Bacteroidales bacterium]|nr:sugar transferase [Bacteroidales bacterium]HOH84428.1 sugar transferase [Bacteroidales bacterium]HPB24154.1 sugar transferase [Bacteroidales bacterium]HPI29562.1 sugar transferase [Bacteroidales bacterium]HQN14751.1 sugar transferase [Bacteroidales bacterium]